MSLDRQRILVMIPSRDRPEECVTACRSVWDTAISAVPAIYVDDDQESAYRDAFRKEVQPMFLVGPRVGPVASINRLAQGWPQYAAYGMITDDTTMTTKGWDGWLLDALKQFPNRVAVVSPYHNQGNHVDMPFVSREWMDATGWFAYPRCFHYAWPIITGLIGEMSAIVHAPFDRFAVHHPPKTEIVSLERLQADHTAFFEFVALELPATVERVRGSMQGQTVKEVRATIPSENWP